jgi:hypothetical protein
VRTHVGGLPLLKGSCQGHYTPDHTHPHTLPIRQVAHACRTATNSCTLTYVLRSLCFHTAAVIVVPNGSLARDAMKPFSLIVLSIIAWIAWHTGASSMQLVGCSRCSSGSS